MVTIVTQRVESRFLGSLKSARSPFNNDAWDHLTVDIVKHVVPDSRALSAKVNVLLHAHACGNLVQSSTSRRALVQSAHNLDFGHKDDPPATRAWQPRGGCDTFYRLVFVFVVFRYHKNVQTSAGSRGEESHTAKEDPTW
jgi:hypothetical protein